MDPSEQVVPTDTIRFLNLNIHRRKPLPETKDVSPSVEKRSPSPMPVAENLTPAEVFSRRFRMRNISTGEEIDIRDENEADYVQRLARLLASREDGLESY